jgi:hypothetical protein
VLGIILFRFKKFMVEIHVIYSSVLQLARIHKQVDEKGVELSLCVEIITYAALGCIGGVGDGKF